MKKRIILVVTVLISVLLIIPIFSACTDRAEFLKVYNWAEYINIDENIIGQFEEYYKQTTGKNIKVQYKTFDTNETLLTKVAGKVDYDVICPSDYVVEKLRVNDMLIKLQKDLGKDINGNAIKDYRDSISELCKNRDFDPSNEYSRAYTWGTLGILYNPALLKPEHLVDQNNNGHPDFVENWGALWSSDYKNKIYMKDSLRDTFAIGAIYTFQDEIRRGEKTISEVLNATDTESIKKVEANLIKQKKLLLGYEVDNGKQDAIDGKVAMTLQWGGDAVWAIQDAKNLAKPVNLNYIIPNPGSNIFFDAWCIPKYSGNSYAAQLFINFMCRPDISIANMDYIGYSSPSATEDFINYMNENYSEEYAPRDLSYFLGANSPLVSAPPSMYPDTIDISKLAVMADYGKRDKNIINMWINVKSA